MRAVRRFFVFMTIDAKPDPVPLSAMQLFRQATGAPWSEARRILERASPLLYARTLAAAEFRLACRAAGRLQYDHMLIDPIEHDPATATLFREAVAEVEKLTDDRPRLRRGSCFRNWVALKNLLRDQYGIEWFTPVEMNPWMSHD